MSTVSWTLRGSQIGAAVSLLWIYGACAQAQAIDPAGARVSQAGHYQVSYESRLKPIEINRLHAWVLHVETPDGAPVTGAAIAISGGMPAHSHGLPTEPRMTQELGGGDYLIEGLKFQMTGVWEVTFAITAGAQADSVTFELAL